MKNHFIEHKGRTINCEINKRRNSKSLRMHINARGIVKVSIPYYTSYSSAMSFIDKNVDWIEKKLNHYNEQRNKYYYLGKNINIIKMYNANNKYFNYINDSSTLEIVTNNKSISEFDLFLEFLGERANEYIPQRVQKVATTLGFEYNSVQLSNSQISEGQEIEVQVKIKNTGKFYGAEIVQVYASDNTKTTDRPPQELVGFEKVHLKPGEEKTTNIKIRAQDLMYYNVSKHDWELPKGEFILKVGASSRDIKFEEKIRTN